jgi:hypothetical protein
MINIRFILITLLLSISSLLKAEPLPDAEPGVDESVPAVRYDSKPAGFEFVTNIWGDLKTFVVRIDPVNNYKPLLGIAISTAVLLKYDQEIIDESQRFARRLGLISDNVNGRESRMIVDLSFLGFDLPVRAPLNVNAGMYFIGDGLTHIAIAGGLAIYGSANDDYRALNTSSQVMESIIVTGIVVQVLKRSTGHESPYHSTTDGGSWDFFPSQKNYISNVPKYDAYPSGHLATAMATTRVLASNYPEHRWIKPTGYTLMGILSFAMMNNGVHWASDYPLGIAIGYLAADVAIERGKARRAASNSGAIAGIKSGYFFPSISGDNNYSINYVFDF